MKIRKMTAARLIRESVKTLQYPLILIAVVIVASMVPGDNVQAGTFASVLGLVLLALADAVISIPALLLAKRLERPVIAPVPVR